MASDLLRLLDTASKFALFSVSGQNEKLMKKETYMETETCKLYSEVIWIFLPNFIKIDPYNFWAITAFKVGAFFDTQCRQKDSGTDDRSYGPYVRMACTGFKSVSA